MVEIYMEKLRDLLDPSNTVKIHESKDKGFYLSNCEEVDIKIPEEMLDLLARGSLNR